MFFQIRGDNWLELCQDFLVVTVHCLYNSCSGQQLLSLFSGSIKRLMIIYTSKSKRHILMRLQSLIVLLWAFFNSQFLKQQIMINWNPETRLKSFEIFPNWTDFSKFMMFIKMHAYFFLALTILFPFINIHKHNSHYWSDISIQPDF